MSVATPMSPWALVVRLILVAIGLRRLMTEGKLPAVQLKKAIRLRAEDIEALVRMGYQQVRRRGTQA